MILGTGYDDDEHAGAPHTGWGCGSSFQFNLIQRYKAKRKKMRGRRLREEKLDLIRFRSECQKTFEYVHILHLNEGYQTNKDSCRICQGKPATFTPWPESWTYVVYKARKAD